MKRFGRMVYWLVREEEETKKLKDDYNRIHIFPLQYGR